MRAAVARAAAVRAWRSARTRPTPIRANFGRVAHARRIPHELRAEVAAQLARARRRGRRHPLRQAARRALPRGRRRPRAGRRRRAAPSRRSPTRLGRPVPVLGLGGRDRARGGGRAGCRSCGEAFLDRGYRADGSLVPRGEPGALLDDPAEVAERAVRLARRRRRSTAVDGSARARRTRHPCACTATRPARWRWPAPCGRRWTPRASRCGRRGERAASCRWASGRSWSRSASLEDVLGAARRLERSRPTGRRRHRARPRARCWCASTRARCRSRPPARGSRRRRRRGTPRPRAAAAEAVVLDIAYDGAGPRRDRGAARRSSPDELVRAARGRALDGRLHRVRARLRLPREPGLAVRRAAAGRRRARACPRGRGRPRGGLHRRLPARDAGRLAADRHDAGAGCSIRMPHPRRCSPPERRVRFRPAAPAPHGPGARSARARPGAADRSGDASAAASASSNRGCSRPCRTSAGRAAHPSGIARSGALDRGRAAHREPAGRQPPRAPRRSRSRWAACAPSRDARPRGSR